MSEFPIQKNTILLIEDTLYRVVGDYSEVDTPLDYELESITNDEDYFMVSQWEASEKLGKSWKIVELGK